MGTPERNPNPSPTARAHQPRSPHQAKTLPRSTSVLRRTSDPAFENESKEVHIAKIHSKQSHCVDSAPGF
jgi:hypothetical protein